MNSFIKKRNTEFLIFGLIFAVVFSDIRFAASAGSNGSVEQWINLTNQMFYGKQDFLFSYGPLYWLTGGATSMHDAYAFWTSVTFISTIDAFFWTVVISLCYRSRTYILLILAYFLFFSSLALPSALFLWPLAAVAYLDFSEFTPIKLNAKSILALGFLVAFMFYVRFFYGTIALVTFGSYFVSRFRFERKTPEVFFLLLGAIIGYVVIGLLIFHHYISLVNYLAINNQLSFGNSVDMTLDLQNSANSFVAAGLAAIFLNCFVILRRKSLFLTVNILLLIFFKIGFSRTDHYVAYFVIPAAVISCLMIFGKDRLGSFLFVLTLSALYSMVIFPSVPGISTKALPVSNKDFSTPYLSRMQKSYPDFKLNDSVLRRIGTSTIDVYPYNNEYMFANNLNYVHRPLFQNYMTITPKLDARNQRFFESPSKPRFVLWTAGIGCGSAACNPFEGFDQKFALNEDPLTSSTILLNYHVTDSFQGKNGIPAVLLEKNLDNTRYVESRLSTQQMKFGQWYQVPKANSGVVKLRPDLRFTLAGTLKNMLFRGGILKIKYSLASGEIREYRTNILNSRSGIWVSPLPDNFNFEGEQVVAIMIESSAKHYFQPTFRSEWVSVPIRLVRSRSTPVIENLQSQSSLACDGSIDVVNGVSPAPAEIRASGTVRIQGWLAVSAKNGITTEKTYISLTDSAGDAHYVSTHEQDRPDVAAAYKQPALSAAGYESVIDLSDLKGNYTVGLAEVHNSKLYQCAGFHLPLTISP